MPYIAVKAFEKDEATKKEVAERINQIFLDVWGCKPEAITISFEEVERTSWDSEVYEKEIKPKEDKMFILSGEKRY